MKGYSRFVDIGIITNTIDRLIVVDIGIINTIKTILTIQFVYFVDLGDNSQQQWLMMVIN